MNTLREAVGEYLDMRRGLGFKLREAGKGLIDFVRFWSCAMLPTSLKRWLLPGLNNFRTFNRRTRLDG
jgi:hypothetical protein